MAKIQTKQFDRPFLFSVLILTIAGFFIFSSASLGILSRNEELFRSIAFNQFVYGFCGGLIALVIMSRFSYEYLKKYSLVIFLFTVILTLLVFVPGIGWSHGGASRWISILGINFQPSELMKVGYIIFLATYFSRNKTKLDSIRFSLFPFIIISTIVGSILVLQPDNDTFLTLMLVGLAMYYVAGARKRHILVFILIGLIGLITIFSVRPYIRDRVMSYLNPSLDPQNSSYQIQQSLIAIGSGGILGKGFGQSTQKFGFLPEPIGDSIFSVASEEFGFVGSVFIIILFLIFAIQGLKIASRTDDLFGRLTALGLVILISLGSFFNIAAMLGIIPISGTPLLFISHGGTALFMTLAEIGIILNISKKSRRQV